MGLIASSTSHLFKSRPFLFVWASNVFYEFSGALATFCLSILVYELTGSALALGSMWLLYFIPSLILQLFIGPFIDRWNRKWILIGSQWCKAFLFLLLLLVIGFNVLAVWQLYVIQILIGLIAPLYIPANQALLPTIVAKERLQEANASVDGAVRLMTFIAPLLGGFIIQYVEVAIAVLVMAVFSLFSGFLLLSIEMRKTIQLKKTRWIDDFKEGVSYFFKQKTIVWLCFFLTFVQFGVGVTMVIALPYITDILTGTYDHYGFFLASFPLGYVLGSLLVRKIHFQKKRGVMLGSLFIGGLTFAVLAVNVNIYFALLTEAIAGVAMAIFNIHNITLFQQIAPNHLMGKLASVRLFFIRIAMPVGVAFAGIMSEWLGIRALYLVIGSLICIVSLLGLLLPYFKFIDEEGKEVKRAG
ncbi:MFS transporter [Alkalihalobacillus sp. 1P02AB]|uniref:MFS transporter n=1 Tax=Alkalihalobacillus sp. 1P02AB TaxID=3132260 RepID=UPI0039A64868